MNRIKKIFIAGLFLTLFSFPVSAQGLGLITTLAKNVINVWAADQSDSPYYAKAGIYKTIIDFGAGLLGAGGNTTPSPVMANLTQESLDEIRAIVKGELLTALQDNNMQMAQADVKSLFQTIEENYESYYYRYHSLEDPENDTLLRMYLQDIEMDTTALINHIAFDETVFPNCFVNIRYYAMSIVLRHSVFLVSHHLGLNNSIKYLALKSKEYRQKLQSMQNDVNNFVQARVTKTLYSQYDPLHDIYFGNYTVRDNIENKQYTYTFGRFEDQSTANQLANQKKTELINHHINIVGNYNEVLDLFSTFSDLLAYDYLFEDNLVGFYGFDHTERMYDYGKHKNDGIRKNGNNPFLVNGKYEKAISQNRTNYVEVSDSNTLDIGTKDFTISFWVRTGSTKSLNTVIDKRSSSGGYHVVLYGGKILVQLDGASTSHYNYWTSDAATKVNDNDWHLVTITVDRDSPTGMIFYVDADDVASFNPTSRSDSLSNSAPLLIGKHKDSSSNDFEGVLDEVRIYDRVLSADEISLLMYPDVN